VSLLEKFSRYKEGNSKLSDLQRSSSINSPKQTLRRLSPASVPDPTQTLDEIISTAENGTQQMPEINTSEVEIRHLEKTRQLNRAALNKAAIQPITPTVF
jgi:hypothetical protein